MDKESLTKTIDTLRDIGAMRDIAEARDNLSKGNYGKPLSQIKKELNL